MIANSENTAIIVGFVDHYMVNSSKDFGKAQDMEKHCK